MRKLVGMTRMTNDQRDLNQMDGRGFIGRGWIGVVSPEVLSFRKRGPPLTANHFNRLAMIQSVHIIVHGWEGWGQRHLNCCGWWNGKFLFSVLLYSVPLSTKMKNKLHSTRATLSSFQWKKLLLSCASFVFSFLVQEMRRKSLKDHP